MAKKNPKERKPKVPEEEIQSQHNPEQRLLQLQNEIAVALDTFADIQDKSQEDDTTSEFQSAQAAAQDLIHEFEGLTGVKFDVEIINKKTAEFKTWVRERLQQQEFKKAFDEAGLYELNENPGSGDVQKAVSDGIDEAAAIADAETGGKAADAAAQAKDDIEQVAQETYQWPEAVIPETNADTDDLSDRLDNLRNIKGYTEYSAVVTLDDFAPDMTVRELYESNKTALEELYAEIAQIMNDRSSWTKIGISKRNEWAQQLAEIEAEQKFLMAVPEGPDHVLVAEESKEENGVDEQPEILAMSFDEYRRKLNKAWNRAVVDICRELGIAQINGGDSQFQSRRQSALSGIAFSRNEGVGDISDIQEDITDSPQVEHLDLPTSQDELNEDLQFIQERARVAVEDYMQRNNIEAKPKTEISGDTSVKELSESKLLELVGVQKGERYKYRPTGQEVIVEGYFKSPGSTYGDPYIHFIDTKTGKSFSWNSFSTITTVSELPIILEKLEKVEPTQVTDPIEVTEDEYRVALEEAWDRGMDDKVTQLGITVEQINDTEYRKARAESRNNLRRRHGLVNGLPPGQADFDQDKVMTQTAGSAFVDMYVSNHPEFQKKKKEQPDTQPKPDAPPKQDTQPKPEKNNEQSEAKELDHQLLIRTLEDDWQRGLEAAAQACGYDLSQIPQIQNIAKREEVIGPQVDRLTNLWPDEKTAIPDGFMNEFRLSRETAHRQAFRYVYECAGEKIPVIIPVEDLPPHAQHPQQTNNPENKPVTPETAETQFEKRLEQLRETTYYKVKRASVLQTFRQNPQLIPPRERVEQELAAFKKEIAKDADNDEVWSPENVVLRKERAETLAYNEIAFACHDNPELLQKTEQEQKDNEETTQESPESGGLELRDIELRTEDIEKVFEQHPNLLSDLKDILRNNKDGEASKVLNDAIVQILREHFSQFLTKEQMQAIDSKLESIAARTAEQIIESYKQSLDVQAKDKVGFFKKVMNKVTGRRAAQMAATVIMGIGGAFLAPYILAGVGIAAASASVVGATAFGTGAMGRALVSLGFRKKIFNKKTLADEKAKIEKKQKGAIQSKREQILKDGMEVPGQEEKVDFLDAKTLAFSVRNVVRLDTNKCFTEEKGKRVQIMDAEGNLDKGAASTLYKNIVDTCTNFPAKRLEILHNLKLRLQKDGKDYDALPSEEQIKLLDDAIQQEAKFLFTKYSFELTQKAQMDDYMERTKKEPGAMKVVKSIQTVLSGRVMDLGKRPASSEVPEGVHVLGAGVVGAGLYYAYEHSSMLAGVGTSATASAMAYEYGTSKEQEAIAKAYYEETQAVLTDAETALRAAMSGDANQWGHVEETAMKLQGMLSIMRPSDELTDIPTPMINDERLRGACTDFLDQYHRAKLEQGTEKPMTPEEGFEQLMTALHGQVERERNEIIGPIDRGVARAAEQGRRNKVLITALAGAAGFAAGWILREKFHSDDSNEKSIEQGGENASDESVTVSVSGENAPEQTAEPASVAEFQPEIKNNIWNTIEANIKNHPAYVAVLKAVAENDPNVNLNTLSPDELAKVDLDQFSLGTTAIDKLENILIDSFKNGDTTYLQDGLTTDQLKALGLDDITKLNPNDMTPEQLNAIDWEKLMIGDDQESNFDAVLAAIEKNDNAVADEQILSHNKALNDLEARGEIDWDKDFDAQAEALEKWQQEHPQGTIDEYLAEAKQATAAAEAGSEVPEAVAASVPEAGKTDFVANADAEGGYAVIGNKDYIELNSDIEPLGVTHIPAGSETAYNVFEHNGQVYAIADVNKDGVLDMYSGDTIQALKANIENATAVDMGSTQAERLGYLMSEGLSSQDQIQDKLAFLNEAGDSTTLADVQAVAYDRSLQELITAEAKWPEFAALFERTLKLDTHESRIFSLWLEQNGELSEVMAENNSFDDVVGMRDNFMELSESNALPPQEAWVPRNVALYENGDELPMLVRLSEDGKTVEVQGWNLNSSYPENKIPVDDFEKMIGAEPEAAAQAGGETATSETATTPDNVTKLPNQETGGVAGLSEQITQNASAINQELKAQIDGILATKGEAQDLIAQYALIMPEFDQKAVEQVLLQLRRTENIVEAAASMAQEAPQKIDMLLQVFDVKAAAAALPAHEKAFVDYLQGLKNSTSTIAQAA